MRSETHIDHGGKSITTYMYVGDFQNWERAYIQERQLDSLFETALQKQESVGNSSVLLDDFFRFAGSRNTGFSSKSLSQMIWSDRRSTRSNSNVMPDRKLTRFIYIVRKNVGLFTSWFHPPTESSRLENYLNPCNIEASPGLTWANVQFWP